MRDYKGRHHPLGAPPPIEAVVGLMERLELSRRVLIPIFGMQARTSEFLNGKRSLSKNQIKALHTVYGIPFESLMGWALCP